MKKLSVTYNRNKKSTSGKSTPRVVSDLKFWQGIALQQQNILHAKQRT